jgi:hypothetical protein
MSRQVIFEKDEIVIRFSGANNLSLFLSVKRKILYKHYLSNFLYVNVFQLIRIPLISCCSAMKCIGSL